MTKLTKYGRVLLKVSGEALQGDQSFGIHWKTVRRIASEISAVTKMDTQVCLVIGAGNIFRGATAASEGMERAGADYMGMLGTVINALAMQHAIEELGISSRVMSAIPMQSICEPYIRRKAIRHLELGRVVIFAGGTGNPYFTTDTAAALRASEMNCDVLLKGTQVDGVYDTDPNINPNANKFEQLSYLEVLSKDLKVIPIKVPHRDEYSETVGYKIEGKTKKVLFIPDIDKWSEWERDIINEVKKVDYALIDGTFYNGGELNRDMSEIPHPSIEETIGLFLNEPVKERNKIYFIHINHTNPILTNKNNIKSNIETFGFNIAQKGLKLFLD